MRNFKGLIYCISVLFSTLSLDLFFVVIYNTIDFAKKVQNEVEIVTGI